MLIVTNFERFPQTWTAADGTTGRSEFGQSAAEFLRHRQDPDALFVINCDPRLVLDLARQQLFGPRRPVIGVDLVLRQPRGLRDRLLAIVKKLLFRRVDYFLHYFKDDAAFNKLYGIRRDRASFVDFKANIWHLRSDGARPDGEYALCFGRSLRDYDTFFEAIERAGVPGAIVDPRASQVWQHGSRFTRPLDQLPKNVQVLSDDMTNESQARLMARARLVVVPLVQGSLVASGISTILNAMVLGKAVIASAGPGVTDLFDREVLSVPVEDAGALAATITRAWNDDDLRLRTAQAGWEYGTRCGSEQDLFRRIINILVELRSKRRW